MYLSKICSCLVYKTEIRPSFFPAVNKPSIGCSKKENKTLMAAFLYNLKRVKIYLNEIAG